LAEVRFTQHPEEDADESRRLEADDHAFSEFGVFDLPADLQVRK
jgi:predicted dienelactone hydrolase